MALSAVGLAGCPGNSGTETDTSTETDTEPGTDTSPTPTPTTTGTDEPGTQSWSSKFDSSLGRDGNEFVVDGEPVYLNGTTNLALTQPSESSTEQVDAMFDSLSGMGVNVLRTSAFGSGSDERRQPEAGSFNEDAFELLDYVVAKANQHGVRLILSLTSWDDDFGGIPQYAEWAGTDGPEAFYANDEAQTRYRDFVETLLKRTNSYTGVQYREDPAIAVWELADKAQLPAEEAGENVETLHE